jgi:hypothetical protein
VRRLRRLSEEECYLRCYGAGGDPMVRVMRVQPRAARSTIGRVTLSGEDLRRLFELRLDAREAEVAA